DPDPAVIVEIVRQGVQSVLDIAALKIIHEARRAALPFRARRAFMRRVPQRLFLLPRPLLLISFALGPPAGITEYLLRLRDKVLERFQGDERQFGERRVERRLFAPVIGLPCIRVNAEGYELLALGQYLDLVLTAVVEN